LALAVVIAVACAPVVAAEVDTSHLQLTWALLAAEAFRSLLVGSLLAFVVGILFGAARYAGQVMGIQIGFAIVNTIDPQTGAQVSILDEFYYLLAALMFFAVDAHHVVISALVHTCTVLPLFTPLDASAGAWLMLENFGSLFKTGLQIAAPCVIVLLLVSATMGVVVKTVPQINVLVVGFPIKIAAGLLALGLSMTFFQEVYLSLLQRMEGRFSTLIAALR
jgi:flagellar biosynthetic protein FliR